MTYLTLGDVAFADLEGLARHMEDRGLKGLLEHPGQSHPADWYVDRLPRVGAEREAAETILWQAATLLMERSDDSGVLSVAWALCGNCQDPSFFEALLDRLEGFETALPTAAIQPFVDMLPNHFPATHPLLGPRIRAYLAASGRHNLRVEVLLAQDPGNELLDEVDKAVATSQLTESVAKRVASKLCRGRHGELLDAAGRLAPASVGVREAFQDKVARRGGTWFAQHQRDLEHALGL